MNYESKCCGAEVEEAEDKKIRCRKCKKLCDVNAIEDQTDGMLDVFKAMNDRKKKEYEPEIIEKVSEFERIVKNCIPITVNFSFLHQFYAGKKWNPCSRCGEELGIPGGGMASVEQIKRCKLYGKYNDMTAEERSEEKWRLMPELQRVEMIKKEMKEEE